MFWGCSTCFTLDYQPGQRPRVRHSCSPSGKGEHRSSLRGGVQRRGDQGRIYSDAGAGALAAASAFIFSANRISASLAGEYPAAGLTRSSYVVLSQCPHSGTVMTTCTTRQLREAEGARTWCSEACRPWAAVCKAWPWSTPPPQTQLQRERDDDRRQRVTLLDTEHHALPYEP